MRKTGFGILLAIATTLGAANCTRSEASGGAPIKVRADENGFTPPASVTIAKGQPSALEFTRTTDSTCARQVVFPDLNIKENLPLNTPVKIALPAGDAKTFAFQCGMAMFKGSVVVQ